MKIEIIALVLALSLAGCLQNNPPTPSNTPTPSMQCYFAKGIQLPVQSQLIGRISAVDAITGEELNATWNGRLGEVPYNKLEPTGTQIYFDLTSGRSTAEFTVYAPQGYQQPPKCILDIQNDTFPATGWEVIMKVPLLKMN